MSRLVWFVAGEASGDARAVEVMRAMRRIDPGIRFNGAGGHAMEALAGDGFDPWVARAAVLGLVDVLRNYLFFRRKFHTFLRRVDRMNPDAVVLVDYPGFNLRFAKALRARKFGGKILYYISPQVWAWNRARIPRMAAWLDLMVCVFPFEAPMYEASGLHTIFAGHPLLEALSQSGPRLPRVENLLGIFPGSREREIRRIFPLQVAAANIIAARRPGTRFEAAASSPANAAHMRALAAGSPVVVTEGSAHGLMQRATAGIVCSGTATLEAAFLGLPYCLVYKTAWLTFELGRRLVDVDCLGIINILNNYRVNPPPDPRVPAKAAPHVVREFIQHFAVPADMAAEAIRLLDSPEACSALQSRFTEILEDLHVEGASHRAAQALLDHIGGAA